MDNCLWLWSVRKAHTHAWFGITIDIRTFSGGLKCSHSCFLVYLFFFFCSDGLAKTFKHLLSAYDGTLVSNFNIFLAFALPEHTRSATIWSRSGSCRLSFFSNLVDHHNWLVILREYGWHKHVNWFLASEEGRHFPLFEEKTFLSTPLSFCCP